MTRLLYLYLVIFFHRDVQLKDLVSEYSHFISARAHSRLTPFLVIAL